MFEASSSADVKDTTLPKRGHGIDKDKRDQHKDKGLKHKRDQRKKYRNKYQAQKYDKDPEKEKESKEISEEYSSSVVEEKESKRNSEQDSSVIDGTALFKPVPYQDMDKDEGEQVKKAMERIEKEFMLHGKLDLEDIYGMEYVDFVKITGGKPGKWAIRVGPALQVSSVTISRGSDSSWTGFEIDGEISIADYRNNIFTIYKGESDDLQWVTPEWDRIFLNGCTIAPVMGGKVTFSLIKDGGDEIFKGHYDLDDSIDPISSYSQEKISTLTCDGKHGYCAVMEYTKIPFAVIANVKIFCDATEGQKGTTFEGHGTFKVNNVVCLDIKEAVKLEHGEFYCFTQSRSVFAVPVYSPLDVEIKLFTGDLKFSDHTLKVKPSYGRRPLPCRYYFPYEDDSCYRFGISVEWIHYDDFFGRRKWADKLNVKWIPDDHPMRQPHVEVTPDHLVEVFSVLVGGGDSAPTLALQGTIVVRDRGGTVYIFSRDDNCPDKLSDEKQFGRTVSLAWPTDRWIRLEGFYMHFKLKNVQGRSVSRGSLCCGFDFEERYDRRMCRVIRGEDGYFAAVHYSVFKKGKRATVSVVWIGPPSLVFGSIVAGYIGHVYPSSYDEEYNRSIIFKRSEEYGVKVKNGSKIPLLKSRVSAPSNCHGLIVHVNLPFYHMQSPYAGSSGQLVGELSFKGDTNASEKLECILSSETLECILVTVDWE